MNDKTQGTQNESGNIVGSLLRSPQKVTEAIAGQHQIIKSSLYLLMAGVICHAVFGLAIGLYAGTAVAPMTIVKIPLVAVCSFLICFPSLYVFTCVAGSPLTLSQAFMLGSSCMAMTGLILVGLAPVAWLFAVSTENISFVVMLALIIWLLAAMFTARYVNRMNENKAFQHQAGIKVWFVILTIVTMQMVTYLRPILVKPENGWWTANKMFFLEHFGSALND